MPEASQPLLIADVSSAREVSGRDRYDMNVL